MPPNKRKPGQIGDLPEDRYRGVTSGNVQPNDALDRPGLERLSDAERAALRGLIEYGQYGGGFFNVNILPHQAPNFDSEILDISPQSRLIPPGTYLEIFLVKLQERDFLRITNISWEFNNLLARGDVRVQLYAGSKVVFSSGRREPGGVDSLPYGAINGSIPPPIDDIMQSYINSSGGGVNNLEGSSYNVTSDQNCAGSGSEFSRTWSIEHYSKGGEVYIRANEGEALIRAVIENASSWFAHAVVLSVQGWIHQVRRGKAESLESIIP